jgi:glycosyltransferase involved in cell wall biosynthesis
VNPPKISAYIPCFNNAPTLSKAIDSIRNQSIPVDELFIIDDGSVDDTCAVAKEKGVRTIRNLKNFGRGPVRARAIQEAKNDFVLSCDATNVLQSDFCEKALPWFQDASVSAVFGRIVASGKESVVSRWRNRHLFKTNAHLPLNQFAPLATWGLLMRRSQVIAVGNFDDSLVHSEDAELGKRLLAAGHKVVFDPQLEVHSLSRNSVSQVLERYWRWNAGIDRSVSWNGYLKQTAYSIKVMALNDLREGDPLCVPISLFAPHYQFWRSFLQSKNT